MTDELDRMRARLDALERKITGRPPAGLSMNARIRRAAGRPTDAQPEDPAQRDAETTQPAGDWLGRELRARRAPRHLAEQETDRD